MSYFHVGTRSLDQLSFRVKIQKIECGLSEVSSSAYYGDIHKSKIRKINTNVHSDDDSSGGGSSGSGDRSISIVTTDELRWQEKRDGPHDHIQNQLCALNKTNYNHLRSPINPQKQVGELFDDAGKALSSPSTNFQFVTHSLH